MHNPDVIIACRLPFSSSSQQAQHETNAETNEYLRPIPIGHIHGTASMRHSFYPWPPS
jgi:hypothetical protein